MKVCAKAIFILFLFIFSVVHSYSQSDKIIFKAPNETFSSIELQSHNSLPRLGILKGQSYKPIKHTEKSRKYYDSINHLINKNYRAYFSLVEIHFLSKPYSKIIRDRLWSKNDIYSNRNDNNLLLGFISQEHLLQAAPILSSTQGFNKYFRNPSDKSAILNFIATWGGRGSDEFRRNKIYLSYIENNIQILKNWAFDFWKNDQQEAYLVSSITFSDYDFKSKGFWFNISENSSTNLILSNCAANFNYQGYIHNRFPSSIKTIKYIPEKSFEYSIKNKSIFHKMDIENAKKITKNKEYFLVRKIRLSLLNVDYGNTNYGTVPKISLSYNIENPFFKIYKTEDLTNIIAEFDYTKLIYK